MSTLAFAASAAAAVLATTSASSNVALTGAAAPGQQCRVYNEGVQTAFIAWGENSSITAAVDSGIFVAAGNTEVFSLPGNTTYVAAIYASGTGNVRVQRGMGQ